MTLYSKPYRNRRLMASDASGAFKTKRRKPRLPKVKLSKKVKRLIAAAGSLAGILALGYFIKNNPETANALFYNYPMLQGLFVRADVEASRVSNVGRTWSNASHNRRVTRFRDWLRTRRNVFDNSPRRVAHIRQQLMAETARVNNRREHIALRDIEMQDASPLRMMSPPRFSRFSSPLRMITESPSRRGVSRPRSPRSPVTAMVPYGHRGSMMSPSHSFSPRRKRARVNFV